VITEVWQWQGVTIIVQWFHATRQQHEKMWRKQLRQCQVYSSCRMQRPSIVISGMKSRHQGHQQCGKSSVVRHTGIVCCRSAPDRRPYIALIMSLWDSRARRTRRDHIWPLYAYYLTLVSARRRASTLPKITQIWFRRYATGRVRCEHSLSRSITSVWFDALTRVDALGVNGAVWRVKWRNWHRLGPTIRSPQFKN